MTPLRESQQAGKLKFFGTRPNWVVSYVAYTKFHSPRPVFHLPGKIFTRIGERGSASFPACPSEMHIFLTLSEINRTELAKTSSYLACFMMTSWYGNIFRISGPLCEETTGHQKIPLTKASDRHIIMFSLLLAWTKCWSNSLVATHSRNLTFMWYHCNAASWCP